MKVTVEYNLDDYELNDKQKLEMALAAERMYLALWQFNVNTYKKLEWELEQKECDKYEALELVFKRFRETLEDYHIDLTMWD
jgi:hypothetical protein